MAKAQGLRGVNQVRPRTPLRISDGFESGRPTAARGRGIDSFTAAPAAARNVGVPGRSESPRDFRGFGSYFEPGNVTRNRGPLSSQSKGATAPQRVEPLHGEVPAPAKAVPTQQNTVEARVPASNNARGQLRAPRSGSEDRLSASPSRRENVPGRAQDTQDFTEVEQRAVEAAVRAGRF